MDEKQAEELFRIAFEAGKQWGLTYSGWFIPTEQDHKEALNKAMNEAKFKTTVL